MLLPRLVILATLMMALVSPAQAGTLRGEAVSGVLSVGSKQVPLPAGNWLVAADRDVMLEQTAGKFGVYGSIRHLVLFRVEGSEVTAFVEIHANNLPVTDGWGVSRDCARADTYASIVRYSSGWDALCFFLHHTMTDATDPSAGWRAAMAFAAESKLTLPPVWVTAGFRAANRRDFVDARYSFSPSAYGVAAGSGGWRDGEWHKDRFEKSPERVSFVQAVARWAAEYVFTVEDGLKRRLEPATAFAWPDRNTVQAAASPSATQRLAILEKLFNDGHIGREEYDRQRLLLTSGKAVEPDVQVDAATVAFWKTAAYRPMVSTANLFIDYYWIGQPFAAGVLVVLQVVVNTTKFYFHELAWERYFGGGAGKRENARVVDVKYAGFVAEEEKK